MLRRELKMRRSSSFSCRCFRKSLDYRSNRAVKDSRNTSKPIVNYETSETSIVKNALVKSCVEKIPRRAREKSTRQGEDVESRNSSIVTDKETRGAIGMNATVGKDEWHARKMSPWQEKVAAWPR